jgi:hypothetical protein
MAGFNKASIQRTVQRNERRFVSAIINQRITEAERQRDLDDLDRVEQETPALSHVSSRRRGDLSST